MLQVEATLTACRVCALFFHAKRCGGAEKEGPAHVPFVCRSCKSFPDELKGARKGRAWCFRAGVEHACRRTHACPQGAGPSWTWHRTAAELQTEYQTEYHRFVAKVFPEGKDRATWTVLHGPGSLTVSGT